MTEVTRQPEAVRPPDDDFITKIIVGLYGEGTAERFLNFKEVDEAQWLTDKPVWELCLGWPDLREKAQKFVDSAPKESFLRKKLVELIPTIKNFSEQGLTIYGVLIELFPEESSKVSEANLEMFGKKIEERLQSDSAFESVIRKYLDDPRLADKQIIREWLRARISAAALTSVGETRSARVGMLQGLRSGQQTPAEKPGNAPPIAPSVEAVPQSGQTPQAATTKPTEPPKKETAAEFRDKLQRDAPSGGLFETFGKALAALASLMENFKDWDPFKALGLSAKTPETQEKKSTGVKFTDEELAKIALDTAKNKDKVYPGGDKAVEYVAAALNLPLRETPQIFLDSLKDSGMVFEQSMDKLPEIEPGDILFFKKADDKGEDFAYTCAVVTNKEPLKMNMVPDGGGAPQPIEDAKNSDYFKNSWYGFVKTKRDAPQH